MLSESTGQAFSSGNVSAMYAQLARLPRSGKKGGFTPNNGIRVCDENGEQAQDYCGERVAFCRYFAQLQDAEVKPFAKLVHEEREYERRRWSSRAAPVVSHSSMPTPTQLERIDL